MEDPITKRLVSCFQTVFSGLSEAEVLSSNQSSMAAWDSVAAITLMNVIEEEFGIEMDFEQLAELDSFSRVHEYLNKEVRVP